MGTFSLLSPYAAAQARVVAKSAEVPNGASTNGKILKKVSLNRRKKGKGKGNGKICVALLALVVKRLALADGACGKNWQTKELQWSVHTTVQVRNRENGVW